MNKRTVVVGLVFGLTVAAGVQAQKQVSAPTMPRPRHEMGNGRNLSPVSGKASNLSDKFVFDSDPSFPGSVGYLQSIHFLEKEDKPRQLDFQARVPFLSTTSEARFSAVYGGVGSGGNAGSKKTVSLSGERRAVHSIQVCLNNDRIKGIRIWGGEFRSNGTFNPNPGGDGNFSEAKRTNCKNNGWASKVSCPANQVAVGIEAQKSGAIYQGLRLICSPYKVSMAGVALQGVTAPPVQP